jgi:hypothetical protein
MRRTGFGHFVRIVVGVIAVVAGAAAQETKTARGTVTAMSGDSVTVKAGAQELKFTVDTKTVLVASGAGTAERKAEASGKPGPRLADFVKTGDAVEVTYVESAGMMRATNIRRVASPGAGGGTTSDERAEMVNGTVDSISGSMLTISGSSGGGASFKQSFTIDAKTQVVAAGAGTASAKGKINLTEFVGVGDQVTVTYRKAGTTLHADEIRVRSKKK